MTFVDVTYKVTKYAIPLCMRTKFCVLLTVNINIHTYLILNSKARVGQPAGEHLADEIQKPPPVMHFQCVI